MSTKAPKPSPLPKLALRAPGRQQLAPVETRIEFLDGGYERQLGAPNPDAEMGQQLTEQFHRATGGMVEVLKFGAMMMMLEANVSTRGHVKSSGGRGSDGDGLKGWLAAYAPEVKRPTAYRFLHVAQAIAAESYEQLVGAKVAKQLSLPALVTTPAEQLSEKLRAKQLELFDFVSGTSQRSWLDRFAPEKHNGGSKHAKCPHCNGNLKSRKQALCPHCGKSTGNAPLTPEEQRAQLIQAMREWASEQLSEDRVEQKLYRVLDDHEVEALAGEYEKRARELRAWVKTPKRKREEMAVEEVLA